jgi:hypothetical protein
MRLVALKKAAFGSNISSALPIAPDGTPVPAVPPEIKLADWKFAAGPRQHNDS